MGIGKQNRGRGGAILTPNELVLPFGGSYVYANFGENRSRNARVRVLADGQTDTLTYWQTDANRFYNLSHAICYTKTKVSCIVNYDQLVTADESCEMLRGRERGERDTLTERPQGRLSERRCRCPTWQRRWSSQTYLNSSELGAAV